MESIEHDNSSSSAWLDLSNVQCQHSNRIVLDEISLHLNQGEIGALLGPSGCGKTTLLRAIAGLHQPITHGNIRLGKRVLNDTARNTHLAPEQRNIGLIFQDLALFPHLTVHQNIGFGLHNKSKNEQHQLIQSTLELVELSHLSSKFPHELSGGQQQRVAIARALASKPCLLLMDEPFSSLDTALRKSLTLDLRDLLKSQGITALIVTHNQEEALSISDRAGYMTRGRLEQWDTPYNLYHEPLSRTVAGSIGIGEFIEGECISPTEFNTSLGTLKGDRAYPFEKGTKVSILIRPEDIIFNPESSLKLHISQRLFVGASFLYTLSNQSKTTHLQALINSHSLFEVGDTIGVELDTQHLIVFKDD